MERYLLHQITKDLEKKMVFVSGPRQVGKTTLAESLRTAGQGLYYNWDIPEHREAILLHRLDQSPMWGFDEIHKYPQWRAFLKGLFDQHKQKTKILVTGSARLDLYSYGGDSLQGRYHLLRLHPFSAAELGITSQSQLTNLLQLGGFPEPFLSGSETEAKRWSREYRKRLVQEEIRDLEFVKDLAKLELLSLRLPDLVGSPLSLNSLAGDLQVSHGTVSRWLDIFEKTYHIFRLSPFGAAKIRAVKKERKHYHFNWSLVEDLADRFENMLACHLLKWVHFKNDVEGLDYDLRYFRDIDKREVDFVIVNGLKPICFIECKWKDKNTHSGLRYLRQRFPNVESVQVCFEGDHDFVTQEGIRVVHALKYLSELV